MGGGLPSTLNLVLGADFGNRDLVHEVTTEDGDLLGGRELAAGVGGHGLSFMPFFTRRWGESSFGWGSTGEIDTEGRDSLDFASKPATTLRPSRGSESPHEKKAPSIRILHVYGPPRGETGGRNGHSPAGPHSCRHGVVRSW